MDIIEATRKNCDFCSLSVASDSLNTQSISGEYEQMFEEDQRFLVADGAFKHQDYNALFIAKKHNPLTLDLEDYKALFTTANKWFEAVIKGTSCFTKGALTTKIFTTVIVQRCKVVKKCQKIKT